MNNHKAQAGDLLSRLVGDIRKLKENGIVAEILVGTETMKFLDRCTGGKKSFMGIKYFEVEGVDLFYVHLKRVGKG